MNFNHSLVRSIVLAASMACAASPFLGCLRERHLLGEEFPDAASDFRGGSPGGGDATAQESDAGGGGPAADGSMPNLDSGPSGAGGAGGAVGGPTVVSLGAQGGGGWPIAITPQEVARRLSQLVFRKLPSAALTAAVVASAPKTNEDVGRLTDGLLLDESSAAGRQAFYRWWLNLNDLATITRDPALFPEFSAEARAALVDQALAFAEDITWRPQGDLTTLLTEASAFVTPTTAHWFPGTVVPSAGTAPTRVVLDAASYAGILTQPAVVATAGWVTTRAEPSGRGMALRTRYLCQLVPPEPPSTPIIAVPAGVSIRDWLTEAMANPGCTACHSLIDPPGFAFGHFDAVGAYHDTEGGLPVDTTGVLTFTSADPLAFAGVADLSRQLAALPEVRTCFAIKWLAFASGRFPQSNEVGTGGIAGGFPGLDADADYIVKRATIQGQLSLRGTLRAVTETHTFLDPQ